MKAFYFLLLIQIPFLTIGQTSKTVRLADSLLKPGHFNVAVQLMQGKEIVDSDSTSIEIIRDKSFIVFSGKGKLSLFNNLKIDINKMVVYFDNRKTTMELAIKGKFYAPSLNGFESHMSKEIGSKHQTPITDFAFSIGVNSGGTNPTLCLLYVKPHDQHTLLKPEILIVTIL